MANARNGNTYFIDTTSDSGTATSYISEKNLHVVEIYYYVDATTDVILLSDKSATSAAVGSSKLSIMDGTAKQLRHLPLNSPLIFPNGIWLTLTGSPKATLVLRSAA